MDIRGRGIRLMWTSVRYEKACLSKKERTTCIGNRKSVENPKRFNVKNARKRDSINNESYFALRFLRKAKPPKPRSKRVDGSGTCEPSMANAEKFLLPERMTQSPWSTR